MPSPTGRPEKMNESAPILQQSASAYFQQLADLMLSVEVTDRQGDSVSLEAGANGAAELIGSVKSVLGKVMVIGNGGSASIASHMQNDLCKALGVRAMVFNEPPLLMALSSMLNSVRTWANPSRVRAAGNAVRRTTSQDCRHHQPRLVPDAPSLCGPT